MRVAEAKPFVGRDCMVVWHDRHGNEHATTLLVEEVIYLPPYGAYLVSGSEEICVERIRSISPLS